MNHSFRILEAPTASAFTLAQAKKSLEIETDFTEDDTLIDELRAYAINYVEETYDCRLSRQRVELLLQYFPRGNRMTIPIWPVQSIDSFVYRDSSGDDHTLAADTGYKTRLMVKPAEIVLPYNASWPGVTLDTADPIRIGMTVGYMTGLSPETLPMPGQVPQALRLLIGQAFEFRAPMTDDATARAVRQLLVNLP